MSDEFYDYFFEELGVSYMWQFQLMPIGRADELLTLMVQPEQRVELFKKWEYMLEEKKYPLADFWNSGVLSNGCVAYGRAGGYLYIDWNGNILPCVFVPYYVDNVYDLYNKGKTLTDALFSKFMINGRKWQDEYGYAHRDHPDNWLLPCSIRDHYENFRRSIITDDAKPEDESAEKILHDEAYFRTLSEYDKKLEALTLPIWKKEYLDWAAQDKMSRKEGSKKRILETV
ncbi:MAG TPA: radical SAM/SPASM domain-containing protein [Caldithrix abyssi]|uniref:Radical SAM/SPASM domain-containing protein n=1 Tax=Caldithrix abyssi TaxID=187145 RepID=A0A7V5PNM2_CALAY|nr:radical SAM/SPASM domain-containing protein [Caldithrix abyssi]